MARSFALWTLITLTAALLSGHPSWAASPGAKRASYEESAPTPALAGEQVEPAAEPGSDAAEDDTFDEATEDSSTSDNSADEKSTDENAAAKSVGEEENPYAAKPSPTDEPAASEPATDESHPAGDSSSEPKDEASTSGDAEHHEKANPDSASSGEDSDEPELIQERYPNRAIKVEREVKQDANGNYVNHGIWKMWDQRGNVVAEGQFQDGERDGTWNRWYRTGEVELLRKAPYSQFIGPFISQATFVSGKLDGKWTIFDAKQHKISEWDFSAGQRNGKSIWWYSNGQKMREIEYREGEIDGQFVEWTPDAQVTVRDTYQGGRRIAKKVAEHNPGQKKSEGTYLFAKDIIKTADDYWNCQLATYQKAGKDEKHGPWTSWYSTGQKQMIGEYRNDAPVGKFTWWHLNGQKALEGSYVNGKQHGRWIWWHQNGQKSIQGDYVMGNPTGHWSWWGEDGKVSQAANLSHSEGKIVDTDSPEKDAGRTSRAPSRSKSKYVR